MHSKVATVSALAAMLGLPAVAIAGQEHQTSGATHEHGLRR